MFLSLLSCSPASHASFFLSFYSVFCWVFFLLRRWNCLFATAKKRFLMLLFFLLLRFWEKKKKSFSSSSSSSSCVSIYAPYLSDERRGAKWRNNRPLWQLLLLLLLFPAPFYLYIIFLFIALHCTALCWWWTHPQTILFTFIPAAQLAPYRHNGEIK